MKVIHSCQTWLPQTQTWLHTQITCLPDPVLSHVVCRRYDHPSDFPLAQLSRIPSCVAEPQGPGLLRLLHDRPPSSTVLRLAGRVREQLALTRLARLHGVSLIHSHFGPIGWRDVLPSRLARTAHVVTFYGMDVAKVPQSDPRWTSRYRTLFEHVDLVLCEGEHMSSEVVLLGCPPDKVRVHRLGIRLEDLQFRPRSRSSGQPYRVLMAASFREKKGFPYGLKALQRLLAEVDLELTIIGDGSPEERSFVQETISALGLTRKVRLLGMVPRAQLVDEAYQHHVFLSPSVTATNGDTEGGAPVSIIEMMATGMPVVSTFHCDIPNVVVHETTGFLAPERDVDGLVVQLRRAFCSEANWSILGAAARRRVETEFDAQRQGPRLMERYQEAVCLAARRRGSAGVFGQRLPKF